MVRVEVKDTVLVTLRIRVRLRVEVAVGEVLFQAPIQAEEMWSPLEDLAPNLSSYKVASTVSLSKLSRPSTILTKQMCSVSTCSFLRTQMPVTSVFSTLDTRYRFERPRQAAFEFICTVETRYRYVHFFPQVNQCKALRGLYKSCRI